MTSQLHPRRATLVIALVLAALAATRPASAHPERTLLADLPSAPAGAAWAQPSPEAAATAEAAFDRGNALLRDARFPAAAAAFREALAAWDHPLAHYHLALALINLDEPVAVVEALERATAAGAAPLGDDVLSDATSLLALARNQVGTLEVTVEYAGTRVFVDDEPVVVGPGTWRARLRQGEHVIRGEAPRMVTFQRRVLLVGAQTERIEVAMYTDTDVGGRSVRRPLPRWTGYMIGGVGIVTAFAGATLQANAHTLAEQYEADRAACAGDTTCLLDPALLTTRDTARTRRGASFVLYGAGAGLVALGALVVWYERPRFHRTTLAARARLLPVLDRDHAGLAAVGLF